jgi:hypothetical protein
MINPPRFYSDLGRADVENLARAICIEFGSDPDMLVPETGYESASAIPLWWKYQGDAIKFIAMNKVFKK